MNDGAPLAALGQLHRNGVLFLSGAMYGSAMGRPTRLIAPFVILVSVARVANAQSSAPPLPPPLPPSDAQAAPSPAELAPPATRAATETGEALPFYPDASIGESLPQPARPEPEPETRWYGYQNMLVDLGGIVLTVASIGARSEGLAVFALGTYLLGSPSVHWAHGQVGQGFGSLGIRVVAPLVGAGLGCAADNNKGELGCLGGLVLGGLVAGVAGMVVDDAVLAREEVPKEAAKLSWLTPSFAFVPESGRLMPSVGLGGTF